MVSSSNSSCRQLGIPLMEEEQGPGDEALNRRLFSAKGAGRLQHSTWW